MGKTIRLFMWAYQHVLRISIESLANNVFAELNQDITPVALLVGIRVPEVLEGHPVCLEPEDEDWDPSLFSACAERATQIYFEHPAHNIVYGDGPSMRDKPENMRKDSARTSVIERLHIYDTGHETMSYCGAAVRVGNYHVVPIVQIKKNHIKSLQQIPHKVSYADLNGDTMLFDSIMRSILYEATQMLSQPEPGRHTFLNHPDVNSILRKSADEFCSTIGLSLGSYPIPGIFDFINNVSSRRYEGGETRGEIAFTAKEVSNIDFRLRFRQPIPLTNHGLARKIVEMSSRELVCIYETNSGIVGLGVVQESEYLFRAVFTGHYKWDLYYGVTHLMTSAFGVPGLPSPRLDKTDFISNAMRVLNEQNRQHLEVLWACVSSAMSQKHGTMVVITEDAVGEALRLAKQSLPVHPIPITPGIIKSISGVDGAILVSPDCTCYAIGVILDGLATPEGDQSRGARYNSAIRYFASSKSRTLCVVISEDGNVDMIPHLRRQISKIEIQDKVSALSTLNHENYHKVRNWLDNHRFYLTREQCYAVNRELARIEDEERDMGEIRICLPLFEPNPSMDESYYLD